MANAKEQMNEVQEAIRTSDVGVLDRLSRSEYKSVAKAAQDHLNKLDGVVDEKGKDISQPLKSRDEVMEKIHQVQSSNIKGWISATPEEVQKYSKEGKLVGYNPETSQVLLK